MGILLDKSAGNEPPSGGAVTPRRVTLGERCLVGRGPRCTLRLDDPLASSEHARLRWSDDTWYVRDLGSSNGTVVDDVSLAPGRDHPLKKGSVLCFGNREARWCLVDASGPGARAVLVAGTKQQRTDRGILTLPNGKNPEAQVFRAPAGGWILEQNGEHAEACDQQIVERPSGRWRLDLPPLDEAVESTFEGPVPSSRAIDEITLHFTVSHDGEDVELRVLTDPEDAIELGVRVYNEMLLELARTRLADAEGRPEIDTGEHGWVYTDELTTRAALRDESQLNQYVFHARKQLARAGIDDAARLIERSRRGRLRLGTSRIVIDAR